MILLYRTALRLLLPHGQRNAVDTVDTARRLANDAWRAGCSVD